MQSTPFGRGIISQVQRPLRIFGRQRRAKLNIQLLAFNLVIVHERAHVGGKIAASALVIGI